MPEEYFDIAHINFDEAILHGRITAGNDEHGCRIEAQVRVVLSEEQKKEIGDLQFKQQLEMDRLLSRIAHEAYP